MNVDLIHFRAPKLSAPAPEPVTPAEPTPETPPSGAVFGIDASGNLFHVDEGWSAGFHYLCVNGNCYSGTRADGFFERAAAAEVGIGQTVSIQFKVEDNGGQCLTGDVIVTRQPGLTAANSPCANAAGNPAPEPDAVSDPEPVAAPDPAPEPDPAAAPEDPSRISSDGSSERGAGLISVSGDSITTRLAERFRDRHESDRSHDTYINEYAQGSAYEIVLIDRPDSLEVQIHSPQAPLSMVNFRHDHILHSRFADPPQYRGGGFMAKGSLDGPADDFAGLLVNRLYFEMRYANGRPWSEVRNNREIVTLEFTPRRELNGNFPQYYSDMLRYRAGQGGVTFERDDARYFSAGPTTNFAHGSSGFEFSQPYLGIDQPSLHAFTLGRELFRANFLGDPLPGNGGNAIGADPDAAASACVNCHFRLGKGAPPGRGSEEQLGFIHGGQDLRVAPPLIGLGLLEAVDPSTIAQLALKSGGKVPDGRFGWKATEPTIRDQILKAFALDMGVRNVSNTFVDLIEAYIRGLGVPIRRHPVAGANQEPNVDL
ncbi:MAG: family 31 carbohydrate-binding protein, partial [Planctomycetes bacterium]|nr:family 31 carbohydrate-binding protein [Planctomycetota bacterium]